MTSSKEIIERLELESMPEAGGFYRETYRDEDAGLSAEALGIKSKVRHSSGSAIYYLITQDNFSALHRISCDQIYHFYSGDLVEMIQIDEQGTLTRVILGPDILNGQSPQVVTPKGSWQALRIQSGGSWSLLGISTTPSFEFQDFELGNRNKLMKQFPLHSEYILKYSR